MIKRIILIINIITLNMLSSNLLKTSSQLLSTNATFLNRVIASGATRDFSSVAFNVRSKFEEAYQKKKHAHGHAPKKE